MDRPVVPPQRLPTTWEQQGQWLRRQSVRSLPPEDRDALIEAQVRATRPIVSGVVFAGAVVLSMTGFLEAFGVTPGIGYPWWAVEGAAFAVSVCALGIRRLQDWRPRLVLTLFATALLGMFLSVPLPGFSSQLAIRAGLFQLLPIALLSLLARPVSIGLMVLLMIVLAELRVQVDGVSGADLPLYWMYTAITIAFGLMLGGYRTAFAVATFKMGRRLRTQAFTDDLTGLLNRAGWNRDATEAYSTAVARGVPLSVTFFDIDHFKAVNDTYGHAAGDTVLQTLGRIIGERFDHHSYGARLGGEEFAVLFIDTPAEQVEGFVRRVRRDFEEAAKEFGATVSAGVAHWQPAEDMSQLLRRADAALYLAKAEGRDRMVVSRVHPSSSATTESVS